MTCHDAAGHDSQALRGQDLSWLLEDLLAQTPGTEHALLLSRDGLKMCWTSGLDVDQADHLSAIASGILSLSLSAAAEFGTGRGAAQAMVEFRGGVLLIVPASEGSHLAVLTAGDADVGVVGRNMNELAARAGSYLSAAVRQPRHSLSQAP